MIARALCLTTALALLAFPVDALAEGKGHKRNGNGPAFCRSGAGHPVHGWEWCRERGWTRDRGWERDRDGGRDSRRGRDQEIRRGDRTWGRFGDVAFENGYADGYEKGLDDGRDGREYDPTRHKWYRSGTRHYEDRYGSRTEYANVYRDGFRDGYEAGFRDAARYGRSDRGGRLPWPF